MSPVITLTFSPCIDKSTSVSSLIPEKKLHCETPRLEPGGGGINVARALLRLGTKATAVYPEGGYSGKFFSQLLQAENVPAIAVETSLPTRENLVVLETASNKQYRFGMPSTKLLENEWQSLLQQIKEMEGMEYLVASGSLPDGMPDNIFAMLADICKAKNTRLVIDAAGPSLEAALEEGIFMAKPNLGELAAITGKHTLNDKEVYSIARDFIQKKACEIMVVSMGSGGALIAGGSQLFRGIAPVVRSVSTVGAGDSMVAGIVHALRQEHNLQKALAFGIACGTAATLRPGTDLCRKQDVEEILPDVKTFAVDE
jgi:6-phosphofructokinase 2